MAHAPKPADALASAAATLDYRLVEGRLTGGFAYRPLKAVTRGASNETASIPLLAAAASVAGKSPRSSRDIAVYHLLLGHRDEAIDAFDEALRRASNRDARAQAIAATRDAELLSDVSAAFHARGRAEGDARAHVIAAEAALRGWQLMKTPEIAWNRALTIESLHLREDAAAAWRDELALDGTSPWIAEVRQRIRRLAAPRAGTLWMQEKPRFESAVARNDEREIARIVRVFPRQARLLGEQDHLLAWAADNKQEHLTFCRAIGRALQASNGESMLVDTVAHIDAASPRQRADVARALAVFRDARTFYANTEWARAVEKFTLARSLLARSRSPFADVVRMYLLQCERAADVRRVIAASDAWLSSKTLDERRHPATAAQVRWIRGIAYMEIGRPQAGIGEYERALATFERLGERELAASIELLLSHAYDYVGDRDKAWAHRFAMLEEMERSGSREPLMVEALRLSGIAALEESMPSVALLFLNRHVAWSDNPELLFTGLLWRAAAQRALGNEAAAAADVRRMAGLPELIEDATARALVVNSPELVSERLVHESSPAARQAILDQAIEYSLETGHAFRLSQFYLAKAHEDERMQRGEVAARAFLASIEQLEEQRGAIIDDEWRSAFLGSRQSAYEAFVEFLCRRGEYARAFDIVERSRARTLLDDVTAGREAVRTLLSLAQVQASLPPDTALVEFARAGDMLGVWVVSARAMHFVPIRLSNGAVERLVDSFRVALRGDDERAELAASQALHAALVRPWYEHARAFERLVFVGVGAVVRIPFAALRGERGGFLIERHVISTVPSANVLIRCAARDRAIERRDGPALIVAPATTAAGADGVLLAASRAEAKEAARAYADAIVLEGSRATRAAFIDRAPTARIIHFAGHARAERAGVPRLVFAPGERDAATLMHAEDIRALRLPATRVVVLAACESASESSSASSQGASSLARAFLAAGVPLVIASQWDVEDDAAAELSRLFHRSYGRGADPAAALRSAQLDMIPRHFRVRAWAAFAAVGGNHQQERR
jgi:CHAT domain-containing protein